VVARQSKWFRHSSITLTDDRYGTHGDRQLQRLVNIPDLQLTGSIPVGSPSDNARAGSTRRAASPNDQQVPTRMLRKIASRVIPVSSRKKAASKLLGGYQAEVMSRMEGVFPRTCNVCGFQGNFKAHGHPPRYDARCPQCGSLERHRHFALLLANGSIAIGKETGLIHFAAEDCVKRLIRERTGHYRSADIRPDYCDIVLDIEQLDLADSSIDAIVCFDVLEHVNDRKALSELFRVLVPSGFAVLRTPSVEGWTTTYENKEVRSPRDRLLHFGQEDHVRYYGHDLRDRISDAGFRLEEFTAAEPNVATFGLLRGDKIFVAHKP
jgi:SAM-dependent methyltransferase